MRWRNISIIGVGLLGGSLGLAIRQRRMAEQVTGYVRRKASVREAVRAGAVDHATLDLPEAVRDAELIVLCTPVSSMVPLLRDMQPFLQRGAIVTDVGSVKADVVKALSPLAREAGAHFVGSHPMAGSEQTGVSAAHGALFDGATCVVTPGRRSHAGAVARVVQFWEAVGARVVTLAPAEHDRLVCRSSHLPHLLAAALATHVLDPRHPRIQARLCASGFRDTTRVAAGSPDMWRDIALANRANLARELRAFEQRLARWRKALDQADDRQLERLLATARELRRAWKERPGTASEE